MRTGRSSARRSIRGASRCILAPFVAVVGVDLDRLTIVPVLCACLFACCWYSLARRRVGFVPALIGVAAVTITPLLLSWTELIQSEWPFLAVVGVALVCLDRVAASRARSSTPAAACCRSSLVGLAAAAAFTVRREGLAMVGADRRRPAGGDHRPARLPVAARPGGRSAGSSARLALPHATFLADGRPAAGDAAEHGRAQVRRHQRHQRVEAPRAAGAQPGPGVGPAAAVGPATRWCSDRRRWAGSRSSLFLVLAVLGIVLAVVRYRTRDLHLAAYAIGAFVIGGSFRSPINRYVCTVAPVLMLLALVALYTIVGRLQPAVGRHARAVAGARRDLRRQRRQRPSPDRGRQPRARRRRRSSGARRTPTRSRCSTPSSR